MRRSGRTQTRAFWIIIAGVFHRLWQKCWKEFKVPIAHSRIWTFRCALCTSSISKFLCRPLDSWRNVSFPRIATRRTKRRCELSGIARAFQLPLGLERNSLYCKAGRQAGRRASVRRALAVQHKCVKRAPFQSSGDLSFTRHGSRPVLKCSGNIVSSLWAPGSTWYGS